MNLFWHCILIVLVSVQWSISKRKTDAIDFRSDIISISLGHRRRHHRRRRRLNHTVLDTINTIYIHIETFFTRTPALLLLEQPLRKFMNIICGR